MAAFPHHRSPQGAEAMSRSDRAGAWSRRQVAAAAAALATASLVSGCRVILEDDAPAIPVIPTRTPFPSEAAILNVITSTQGLAERAAREQDRDAKALSDVHREQLQVLSAAVIALNVPRQQVDKAAAAPATGKASDLAAAEADSCQAIPDAIKAPAALHRLLIPLFAQRISSARLLSGKRATLPRVSGGTWSLTAAGTFLSATRRAQYAFNVVRAHSDDAIADTVTKSAAMLTQLELSQRAVMGRDLPPDSPGYDLPAPVTSSAQARALAEQASASMVAEYGAAIGSIGGAPRAFSDTVSWLGDAADLAQQWGAKPSAFPGLKSP